MGFDLPLSDSSSSLDPSALAQYGAVGIVAALSIMALAWLYKRGVAERDRERDELLAQLRSHQEQVLKLQEELRTLNALVQQSTMTALQEATRAVGDAITRMRRD